MDLLTRERPKTGEGAPLQPGMLESMVKRLYIKRFPQIEEATLAPANEAKRAAKRERKKVGRSK